MKVDSTMQDRFDLATRLLETHQHHRLLDVPLWHWLQSDHLHVPVAWLNRTLREVLELRLGEIASTRGIGAKKLGKIVLAVDRVRDAIERDFPVSLCYTDRSTRDEVSESITFPYRVARDAHFLGAKHTPLADLDERALVVAAAMNLVWSSAMDRRLNVRVSAPSSPEVWDAI